MPEIVGNLRDQIKLGALPVGECSRIINDVALALDDAHAHGILHGDIKPESILLDDQGNAHVAGFGVAKSAGDGPAGTPEYMAPEQAKGEDPDKRSDQYSLGIMAYEMLTGVTPFPADPAQPWAVLNRHISDPLPDPRQFRADLPDTVCLALLRALRKSPEDRFATCEEFASALATSAPKPAPAPSEVAPEPVIVQEPPVSVAPVVPVAPPKPPVSVAPVQPVAPPEPPAPVASVQPVAPPEPPAPVAPVQPVAPPEPPAPPTQPVAQPIPVVVQAPAPPTASVAAPKPARPAVQSGAKKPPVLLIVLLAVVAAAVLAGGGILGMRLKNRAMLAPPTSVSQPVTPSEQQPAAPIEPKPAAPQPSAAQPTPVAPSPAPVAQPTTAAPKPNAAVQPPVPAVPKPSVVVKPSTSAPKPKPVAPKQRPKQPKIKKQPTPKKTAKAKPMLNVWVCARSGLQPRPWCRKVMRQFKPGHVPTRLCNVCKPK